jgi:hypothetical protein
LVSHGAKRICVWIVAVVFTAAIALRVEAAIYARRIVSVVTALSTLRVGESSKADALSRIPSLRHSVTGAYGHCDADECFSIFIANGLPNRVLSQTENSTLSALLRWWGFRFEGLDVQVAFTSKKLSYFVYRLEVSAPGVVKSIPPPPRDGEAGAVMIGVSSQSIIIRDVPNSAVEEHPLYLVTPSRAAPSQGIRIALTPNAPEKIVRGTFDLRLNCMWSFGGCGRWNQLLPSLEPLAGT